MSEFAGKIVTAVMDMIADSDISDEDKTQNLKEAVEWMEDFLDERIDHTGEETDDEV